MVNVKILSYKKPQRYIVRQTLIAARNELRKIYPNFDITISEVKTLEEIEKFTSVLVCPSLLINEKLFCTGWFPKKEEITEWLRQYINGNNEQ